MNFTSGENARRLTYAEPWYASIAGVEALLFGSVGMLMLLCAFSFGVQFAVAC
jgi:hypothetical protein